MAWKAMPECTAWLEAERWKDVVRKAGRPAARGDGRQESEPSYYRWAARAVQGQTRTGNGAQTKVWTNGVRPLSLNIGRRWPEKRGVGKPREGRVVGKWKRKIQKV